METISLAGNGVPPRVDAVRTRDVMTEAINLQRSFIPKLWAPDVDENRRLTAAENANVNATDIPRILVGESVALRRLLDAIRRVAPKHVTVLIQGETGTGKELVARAVHIGSPRHDKLFVAVNCAELSQDAAESRLFGHRKGSFTGATDDHKGFFEVADGGTLFLDEIGELPLILQAKLLRALQEGEIVRFGETKPRQLNVRIIAATNRNLEDDVAAGRFRADLLYRLNVVPLNVPPLRERRDDIPVLAEHFLDLHARKLGQARPSLTGAARAVLSAQEFPGNVRDLENLMIRVLVMAEHGEPIGPDDLPGVAVVVLDRFSAGDALPVSRKVSPNDDAGLLDAVALFERQLIERAIVAADGNRAQAARALKISYRWLLKKLERYGAAVSSLPMAAALGPS